jgi:hypothetical protein
MPAWRVFGAALAAFAIAVQILLSGLLIGRIAVAADQPDLSVICAHDAAAGAQDDGTAPPSMPPSHDQCPACACPQVAQFFATPPVAPGLTLLPPRSQRLEVHAGYLSVALDFYPPYASRAPPHAA